MVTMLEELKKNYKGKKVFLTGHTGFKGSWLLKIFDLLEADVMGYALEPITENDLFYLINGNKICTSKIGDLRNKNFLEKELTAFNPDFIFHLAAQPLVRMSYEIPAETFEVNVIGTLNVLESLKLLKKKCTVVVITTDKVYHNNEWEYPYRESDRLGGYDPYSASKACSELVVQSYRNSFFHPERYDEHKKEIAVARAGNVIGGGDWSKDRLIPDIAKAFSNGKAVIIRNPESIRPWQHVLEPLLGYLLLGANLQKNPKSFSQAYNFGPNQSDTLSVKDMIKLAIKKWGSGEFVEEKNGIHYHEAGLLKLDISKTISELKWKPKMNALNAVSLTIDWYKEYYANRSNIEEFTTKQIFDFINE
jgi:CDP-glucose 4,6-dehydratase